MDIGYIYDTGGAPERRNPANDCVPRAIAIVTGIPYDEAYRLAGDAQIEAQRRSRTYKGRLSRSLKNGVSKNAVPRVMKAAGLVKVTLPKGAKPTYAEAHATYGDCIVSTTGHVAALQDGNLRDTFDGRGYEWEGEDGVLEWRERKAMSVWVVPYLT